MENSNNNSLNNASSLLWQFVEIISRSSTDASLLKLILYNGANGRADRSFSLADEQAFAVGDVGSGFLGYTAFIPLQNGPAESMALVSGEDGDQFEVLQFISYEGRVKAADGPAKGMESLDAMAKETEASIGLASLNGESSCGKHLQEN